MENRNFCGSESIARYNKEIRENAPWGFYAAFFCAFGQKRYANRKALGYLGTHSGRDGDKAKAAGPTPVPVGESVGYKEAELTFLCEKPYQHRFEKEDLAKEIHEYYRANLKGYPPDANGER